MSTPDLVWTAADQTFRLAVSATPAPEPTLHLPDGRAIALPVPAWLALRDALRALDPEAPRAARPGPANRGKPWAPDDDERVSTGFQAGIEPAAIAREVGRTRGAVVARLVRLGLMEEAAAGLRYPTS